MDKRKVPTIVIVITFCVISVNSVVMPPRLTSPMTSDFGLKIHSDDNINDSEEDESVPYLLSINEGDSTDVKVNSHSNITINLNKNVPEDIVVSIRVFSGPNLISFEGSSDNKSGIPLLDVQDSAKIYVIFKADTFGDRVVKFRTNDAAGHAEIVCTVIQQPKNISIDDSSAYISVNIGKSWSIGIIIYIVGWIYFFAWSLSFYFQVVLNFKRKSVIGLNFDFLALNLLGFTCYSIYNSALMFSREVQKDYYERNTYSRIPVEYNDLFFALHATAITLITVTQCFIYERGEQKVSLPAAIFVGSTSIVGVSLYISHLFQAITILDAVLYLSYVKLAVTLIKYTPQAYMNFRRKATSGWSIHNVLLDFTGGILSIAQMFLLAYNFDDWISIFGNFTKFGLGVISITFDILFVVQHYVLYKQSVQLEDSIPSPVISQSIRSLGDSRQQQAIE